MMEGVFEGLVSMVVWQFFCEVWLLVLNTGLSNLVAVSIMTVALLLFGNLTNLKRLSAALFLVSDIHLNIIL